VDLQPTLQAGCVDPPGKLSVWQRKGARDGEPTQCKKQRDEHLPNIGPSESAAHGPLRSNPQNPVIKAANKDAKNPRHLGLRSPLE